MSQIESFRRKAAEQAPGRPAALEPAIGRRTRALLDLRRADGHWAFELEADATIPAEYILLQHYLGEIDAAEEQRIAAYLRAIQGKHGGWPLFHDGDVDLSATVKAYFAPKAVGDAVDAPHIVRARHAILARGGAAPPHVFTPILLSPFGAGPWQAGPGSAAAII